MVKKEANSCTLQVQTDIDGDGKNEVDIKISDSINS